MPPGAGSHQRCDPRSRPGRILPLFRKRSFRHSFKRLLHTPASGYRTNTTGALTVVGTEGGCFCSSSSAAGAINAGGPWFGAGRVNPQHTHNRGNALTVRCVQHLQAAFFKVNFAIEREQSRTRSGFAERKRSQAPAGGLKVKGELCE